VRTGIPAGDLIYGDKVVLLKKTIPAQLLRFERQDKMVFYGGTGLVEVGELVFSIWLEDVGDMSYADVDIPRELQSEAKGILESFERTEATGNPPTLAPTATPIEKPVTTPSATPTESASSDPAAGLIYSTAETLWGIDVDGSPVALIDEPTARVSSDGARAVFATSLADPWASDIWLVDLQTGTRRNVTNTPNRDEVNPLWWPGRSDVIGFGSDEDMEIPDGGYPTVIRVDGTGYEVLDDEEGGPVGLSPDGALAAYGGYDQLGRIYRWGGEPELFDPGSYGVSVDKLYLPAWHPDGRHLAWEVGGDLTGEGTWQMGVVLFDLQGGTSQLLHVYEPTGGSFPHYLAWSPDGEWLAFVTYQEPPSRGRPPNLWVVRPRDEREVYVGMGVDPVWSPDGQRLAFTEVRADGNALAVWEVDTWQVQQLDLPHRIESLSAWIAARSLTGLGGDVGSTPAPDGEPTSLAPTATPAAEQVPTPSAEKDLLTYVNDDYQFAFIYPASWELEEIPVGRQVPGGASANAIHLTKDDLRIEIQYKRVGEAAVLGASGRPAGEVEAGDSVTVLGHDVSKRVLVHDGVVKSVFLRGRFDDLELCVQLDGGLGGETAYESIDIPDSAQSALDAILSSLHRTGELKSFGPDALTHENATHGFSFQYPASWTVEEVVGEIVEDDVKLADAVVLRQGAFAIVVQHQFKSDPAQIAWGGDFVPGGLGYAEATLGAPVTLLGEETHKNVWAYDGGVKAVEVNTTGKYADLILSITLADTSARFIQDAEAATIPEFAIGALDQVLSSFTVTQ
jgi:Tol biopolymer transport system component